MRFLRWAWWKVGGWNLWVPGGDEDDPPPVAWSYPWTETDWTGMHEGPCDECGSPSVIAFRKGDGSVAKEQVPWRYLCENHRQRDY